MASPIALQLYTLREALARDFAGALQRVAEIGYAGVETAGFPETTAEAAGRLFRELGLEVCSAHVPLPIGRRKNEVLDVMAALGCRRAVCPSQPAELFQSEDGIRRVCDILNAAHAVAAENGLALGYHNHWWEFQEVGQRRAIDALLAELHPAIFLEIDTYWARTAGADPASLVGALKGRAPLLHVKDGPAVLNLPMTPLGAGVMDFPAIVRAGAGHTEWLIVELDSTEMDALEAVERSFRYLVESGLGRGREAPQAKEAGSLP